MPRKKPLAIEGGKKVWARDEAGEPICGQVTTRYYCRNCKKESHRHSWQLVCPDCGTETIRKERTCNRKGAFIHENGKCKTHGGLVPGAPITSGKKSEKLKQLIRSREQFLEALAGEETEFVRECIAQIQNLARGGALEALKYCIDQLFGGPKTTIVNEIADSEQLEQIIRESAIVLEPDVFQKWLSAVHRRLGRPGDSA